MASLESEIQDYGQEIDKFLSAYPDLYPFLAHPDTLTIAPASKLYRDEIIRQARGNSSLIGEIADEDISSKRTVIRLHYPLPVHTFDVEWFMVEPSPPTDMVQAARSSAVRHLGVYVTEVAGIASVLKGLDTVDYRWGPDFIDVPFNDCNAQQGLRFVEEPTRAVVAGARDNHTFRAIY